MVIHKILFSEVILVRHGNAFFTNRLRTAMKRLSEGYLNRQKLVFVFGKRRKQHIN